MQDAISVLCSLVFGAAGVFALWTLRRDLRGLRARVAALLADYRHLND